MAPVEGQTRAVATIRRLIDTHGEGHARIVLTIFAEGKGNAALADEASLNAVSDLLRASEECKDAHDDARSAADDLSSAATRLRACGPLGLRKRRQRCR